LLRFELLEFEALPLDLSLLRRHLLLHILFLLLPRLHLIADQGAAEQPDSGADAGAGESSNARAFFSRR
jgi:hypothetical protein